MPVNRRKGGRSRRNDELKFAYSGPFAPLLDPIRVLPRTKERYAATSAESYTVAGQLGQKTVDRLAERFGRSAPKRRRSRRGGARRG